MYSQALRGLLLYQVLVGLVKIKLYRLSLGFCPCGSVFEPNSINNLWTKLIACHNIIVAGKKI